MMICGRAKNTATPYSYTTGAFYTPFGTSLGTNGQILCANCLPRPIDTVRTVEARSCSDGSWWLIAMSSTADIVLSPLTFQRLDGTEDGDVSPYLSGTDTNGNPSYCDRFYSQPSASTTVYNSYLFYGNGTFQPWRGYASRGGTAVRDLPQMFWAGASASFAGGSGGDTWYNTINATPMRHANHPTAGVAPLRAEAIGFMSAPVVNPGEGGTVVKMTKGRARWFISASNGPGRSTYGGLRYFAILAYSTSSRSILVGPLDGVTTPVN
jgi:hypothetical protein